MEIHEIGMIFPEMTSEEFTALSRDIAEKGMLEPIWTHDGKIIDGRHRYRVCCGLNLKPEFHEWAGEGGSVLAFVVSKNLHRRQLSASQRATLAAEVKPRLEAEIREDLRRRQREAGKQAHRGQKKVFVNNDKDLSEPRNARAEVAKMFDVSNGYVSDAEEVLEASPETFEGVKAGTITIPEAKRQIHEAAPPRPQDHDLNPIKLRLNPDPQKAAQALLRYFQGERLRELIEALQQGLE